MDKPKYLRMTILIIFFFTFRIILFLCKCIRFIIFKEVPSLSLANIKMHILLYINYSNRFYKNIIILIKFIQNTKLKAIQTCVFYSSQYK
jgi:hypothetical protein